MSLFIDMMPQNKEILASI